MTKLQILLDVMPWITAGFSVVGLYFAVLALREAFSIRRERKRRDGR